MKKILRRKSKRKIINEQTNDEKTNTQKSRDTVPLRYNYCRLSLLPADESLGA